VLRRVGDRTLGLEGGARGNESPCRLVRDAWSWSSRSRVATLSGVRPQRAPEKREQPGPSGRVLAEVRFRRGRFALPTLPGASAHDLSDHRSGDGPPSSWSHYGGRQRVRPARAAGSGEMRTASTLRKGAGWRSFKDEARAACQRRVEVLAGASLKRRTDHARRAGCCGGGCLLEMGPPGIVNATSTACLEDLSV
jgi:hypothetical protein